MKVERLLQINVACMVVLGTLLFAMGQQNVPLPLMMLFAAATSLLFTDTLKWFHLPRSTANLLAVLIAVYTLHNFFLTSSEEKLLAIANLLAYLELALFYEQKTTRVYWHLMVLSLLQVVVAAALDFGFEGGLVLALYFVATVSAMTLSFLYREALRVEGAGAPPRAGGSGTAREDHLPAGPLAARGAEPVAAFVDSTGPTPSGLPWKMILQQDGGLAIAAVTLTVVLFYSLPRHGKSYWTGGAGGEVAQVGFQPAVQLSESDTIIESDDVVMRVAFYDETTNKPYPVFGQPYLRGTVLTDYQSRWGVSFWRETGAAFDEEATEIRRDRPAGRDPVRQEIVLEPQAQESYDNGLARMSLLFAVFPIRRVQETHHEIAYTPRTGQLYRLLGNNLDQPSRFRYVLGTSAFRNGLQLKATPYWTETAAPSEVRMPRVERLRLLAYPRGRLRNLERLAQQILEVKGVDKHHTLLAALTLEHHFLTSDYRYSLNFRRVERDRTLDPIEDFVSNHRTGHCEYFASALALMLRSQGIPARLVVGFKGGDYNTVGSYYQVKQKHAHAWVEAYLEPDQLNAKILGFEPSGVGGAWLRLDPTPATGDDALGPGGFGLITRARHAIDYARVLWADYVLGLNRERQEQAIYKPLQQRTSDSYIQLLNVSRWSARWRGAADGASPPDAARAIGRWLRLAAGCAGLLLCLAALAIYRLRAAARRRGQRDRPGRWAHQLARLVPAWLNPWSRLRAARRSGAGRRVDFYEAFLALLARQGIYKSAAQTQREFADVVCRDLAGSASQRGVADLPRQIVGAYYRVRFGRAVLDRREDEAIQQALRRLHEAFSAAE